MTDNMDRLDEMRSEYLEARHVGALRFRDEVRAEITCAHCLRTIRINHDRGA